MLAPGVKAGDVKQDLGRKVGILGGTFDPVHNGHLSVAKIAQQSLSLDSVMFVPAARPPHKSNYAISDFADRVAMLQSALHGNDSFFLSDLEANRTGPSFTIDTLQELREAHQDVSLYFIIGSDAFAEIKTWKRYQNLTLLSYLVVLSRPDLAGIEPAQIITNYFPDYTYNSLTDSWQATKSHDIFSITIDPLPVSSSMVRNYAKAGQDISSYVPPGITGIINEKGLYGSQNEHK